MTDVEGVPFLSNNNNNNPYRDNNSRSSSNFNSKYNPVVVFQRLLSICVSIYGLQHFHVYHVLLHSPKIRHEWFKIGLASTIGKLSREIFSLSPFIYPSFSLLINWMCISCSSNDAMC